MTAVAVELLTRPPGTDGVPQAGAPNGLAPDAVEFVADTDTLLTMCSCSASSDQPQRGRALAQPRRAGGPGDPPGPLT